VLGTKVQLVFLPVPSALSVGIAPVIQVAVTGIFPPYTRKSA
jgi:hypothetical protein